MKRIEYYVGILPKDENRFWEYVYNLNEDSDERYQVIINGAYDGDYYTFCVIGTWDSYNCFLNDAEFVKSIEHFEQD